MFEFKINNHNNKHIYLESSTGYWSKSVYDKNNNKIYFEDSNKWGYHKRYDHDNFMFYTKFFDGTDQWY